MYCPNPDCPHAERTGEPAEYRPGETRCHDCETPLVEERPIPGGEDPLALEPFAPVLEIANAALVPVVKSLLELAEIHYFISAERAQDLLGWGRIGAGYNIVTGAPTVYVEPSRANEARELLADLEGDDGGRTQSEAARRGALSLVRKWFEAWTFEEVASLPLASEFERRTPVGAYHDRRSYLAAVKRRTGTTVPEIRVKGMLARGSRIAVRYEMRFASETVEACDWIRVRGDELAEALTFYDAARLRETSVEAFPR